MGRSASRAGHKRSGQIVILTALIITMIILSLVALVSQTTNLNQSLKYEPYKEVTEDLATSFRNALASTLANMTAYVNATGDDVKARADAYRYLSKWKEAAMLAYADLGLQIDFKTPLDPNSSYVLQGQKTISYQGKDEDIDAWELYNLSQLYWDQSTGCSASYATLYINLTEYGFYGWKKDIIVASNGTMYPDSLTKTGGRAPADVVLVLDASRSMLFQPYNAGPSQDQNDYTMQLTGSINQSSDWQPVGTIDLGEIPTQFVAVLTWSGDQTLNFRMMNGSYDVQLVISYSNATGDFTQALPAIADVYVRSRYPNNNYGGNQSLEVSGYKPPSSTDYYRVWLKFDLSSLPSGATIDSAMLSLYVQSNYNAIGRTYELHHSNTDSWKESGTGSIKWNNQPSYSSSHVDAKAPSTGLMSWDVTSDVQNDYAGNKLSTWVIKDPSEGSSTKRYIVMNSRESQGIQGYNILTSSGSGSVGQKLVYSTSDRSSLPGSIQGNDFGSTNMWNYSKNGKWMIQLQNLGPGSASYNITVQTRKLDCVRNAATTFLRLLNPNLDRLAIVQFGERNLPLYYYYAAQISKGKDSSPFYDLNDTSDFQAALNDINWRDPSINNIGYGFEWISGSYNYGGTTPLGAGLEVGNRLFDSTLGARPGSQRILIIITDGKENVRPNPPVPAPPGGPGVSYDPTPGVPNSYYSIASNLTGDAYAPPNKVITYTIGFGKDADGYCLQQLAQEGHGQYYFAANGTQLAQILASLAYSLNDKLTFHFSLMQEYESGINVLSGSDLTVYITDPITHQRHKVEPSGFTYQGGGNFMVTASYAGSQSPESVDIVVRDPRGILVRLHLPLSDWGA